jgi:hypothetical protein
MDLDLTSSKNPEKVFSLWGFMFFIMGTNWTFCPDFSQSCNQNVVLDYRFIIPLPSAK